MVGLDRFNDDKERIEKNRKNEEKCIILMNMVVKYSYNSHKGCLR